MKHVSVRIPHCAACSSGAVLVDLPGIGDSNAARDKIAKNVCIETCSLFRCFSCYGAVFPANVECRCNRKNISARTGMGTLFVWKAIHNASLSSEIQRSSLHDFDRNSIVPSNDAYFLTPIFK